MKAFTYERVTTTAQAAAAVARQPGAKFIAGGTNLLDLMKLEIEVPSHLVDVNGLALDKIESTAPLPSIWLYHPLWQAPAKRLLSPIRLPSPANSVLPIVVTVEGPRRLAL
ncbi:putative oxidoreductase [Acidovorax sp. NO-1]|nr:putative oxidoreductase [Acidovorax sp. NO-1]